MEKFGKTRRKLASKDLGRGENSGWRFRWSVKEHRSRDSLIARPDLGNRIAPFHKPVRHFVYFEKVLKSDKPVIVDFYSDSCVACKKLAPVLGGIEDDYEDALNVYKVNTNFDAALAEKYEVTANPTL